MVRFMISGYRDYTNHPVEIMERFGWEVYVVAEGGVAPVFEDGNHIQLESGYVWVMPPQLAYGWRGGDKPVKRYAVHFLSLPDVLVQAVRQQGYLGRKLSGDEIKEFDLIYRRLEECSRTYTPIGVLNAEKAVLDLALLMINGLDVPVEIPVDRVEEERVHAVLDWYREHISESPSVVDAAATFGMSSGHLRRIFKRAHDCSPHNAFISIRLEHAKVLLSSTSRDVSTIGRQSGFRSESDFSRTFTRYTGVSPRRWRIHYARRKQEFISTPT